MWDMIRDLVTKHLAYHDTARPMAAMEVDYPDAASTGQHAHPNGQILYAIEGVMIVTSAQGIWVVPPNRAVWIVPDLVHEVRMRGAVKIRTIFVDPGYAPGLPQESCVLAVSALMRELILAAMDVPLDHDPDSREARLMRLILDEVVRLEVVRLHLPLPKDARLARLCAGLQRDLSDSSGAEVWGARLGISGKTVHRLFQQETGLSFGQWRQQARLLHALERLAEGARVIDAALDAGYASQSAFTAMFRREFGLPPRDFYRDRGKEKGFDEGRD